MLCRITEQAAREAAEDGRRAVDEAFNSLPEAMSQMLGYPVDIILQDRNKDGVRELYIESAEQPTIGYGTSIRV